MTRLAPAHVALLHRLAENLDAAPGRGGERARLLADAAATLGVSVKTVYAQLARHAGWQSGRRPRADRGTGGLDAATARLAGGLCLYATRANGKRTLSVKAARDRLAAAGIGVATPETGEIVMPSAATLARAMRRHHCHPEQLAQAAPAVRLRSPHPNHLWQIDASVCVLYSPGHGGIRLVDEKLYNRHKPGRLLEIARQRIIRYVVCDHYSGALYVRYAQAAGEDAAGVVATLAEAMSDRGERDPMHGAPKYLYMDKGSGNKSSLVAQFLADCDITPLWHAAGNARATGSVEAAQNIVETQFESRLRFTEVPDVAALQALADRWRRHFNARAVLSRAGKTRNALWMTITDAQLRTADREALMACARWKDETRRISAHFRITVDTKSHGVQEYDLRELGLHGLNVGDVVAVRVNPFRAPAVVIVKTLPDGAELRYEVTPTQRDAAGFDLAAPVIGEAFAAPPRTPAQRQMEAVRLEAFAANERTPFAHIDPMADVTEAPQYLRRAGKPVALDAQTAEPAPLNRAQAAQRLAAMCGEAWSANPRACNDMIRARFPRSVPEAALEELATAIRQRFAPRPAAIHIYNDATQGEELTCAG